MFWRVGGELIYFYSTCCSLKRRAGVWAGLFGYFCIWPFLAFTSSQRSFLPILYLCERSSFPRNVIFAYSFLCHFSYILHLIRVVLRTGDYLLTTATPVLGWCLSLFRRGSSAFLLMGLTLIVGHFVFTEHSEEAFIDGGRGRRVLTGPCLVRGSSLGEEDHRRMGRLVRCVCVLCLSVWSGTPNQPVRHGMSVLPEGLRAVVGHRRSF